MRPDPAGPVVRVARREDLDAIVALLVDDDLGLGRERGLEDSSGYRAAFERISRSPDSQLLVAELDGQVVGTFQLDILHGLSRGGASRAQVEAVRVASSERSRGIGRVMMEWAIAEARRRGCAMVQLTTDKTRERAHRFYASLGFVASHEGLKLALEPK